MARRLTPVSVRPFLAVVSTARAFGRRMSNVSGHGRLTLERAAVLLGLTALAVAHPVFDVIANSPEFFVARNTGRATALSAVALISMGVPLLLLVMERITRALNLRGGDILFGLMVGALGGALVMPWLERADVIVWPWDVALSAALGGMLAVAYFRWRPVRQWLVFLAPAAVVVPAAFLLDGSVRAALSGPGTASGELRLGRTPPVVLIVFDEFPVNSLLDADRGIDAQRFPNFAALARRAYWFRNAGTVSSETRWAVPAILSGRYPTTPHDLPTLRYYPVNLFTLLAPQYDIVSFTQFEKLCPAGACRFDAATPDESVQSLVTDLSVVWLHIVLPRPAADRLPTFAGDWRAQPAEAPSRPRGDPRRRAFDEFLTSIDGRSGRLYVLHLLLPHMPFEYVPSGRRYPARDYQTAREQGQPLFENAGPAYADTLHQRHLAQVGYVDRLVGRLIQRLRDAGVDDSALLVLTADHGASFRAGRSRRAATQDNLADIVLVPLLVKLPAQRHGRIIDDPVEVVDILPTMLEILEATPLPSLDGRSLFGERRTGRTFIFRGRANVEPRVVPDLAPGAAASLERKLRRFGSGDVAALYAPPEARHLLGTSVDALPDRQARGAGFTLPDKRRFAAVDLSRHSLPLYVRGRVTADPPPSHIGIVVNGIFGAVTQPYTENGRVVFGTLIPESVLRDGRNAIEAIALDGSLLGPDAARLSVR